MDANDKKLLRNTILIFGIIVVLLGVVIIVNKVMTANAIKELEGYKEFLSENCECLENSIPKCSLEGFEYDKVRNLCVKKDKKLVTYPTLGCSKYDCSGEIKLWNNETLKWEDW
jgi:hypothetical protein